MRFPEYQKTYADGMEISEFKRIYFVEWSHRMVGRSLGFGFVGPLLFFAARGALRRPLLYRLTGLLGLGAFQGGVGWWMVRSGLEKPEQHIEHSNNKNVRVSPYRIAFHWTMALALYGGTLWCPPSSYRAVTDRNCSLPEKSDVSMSKFAKFIRDITEV